MLVTGGAGFIGSHLVHELLRQNHEVVVLDNMLTGRRENLSDVLGDIELVEGDIRDYSVVVKSMRGIDTVMHQAAQSSVLSSIHDPILSADINVLGTTVTLKAAVDAGVRRVIYAASSSVYGNSVEPTKHEGIVPRPLSPYAVTKLAGEYMLGAFSTCYPVETVGLRYFNVFGERQDPYSPYSGVIAKFTTMMLRGQQAIIYGDGLTSRDFTHVANVVLANILTIKASSAVNGRTLNVACGGSVTLNQVVDNLNKILGTNLLPIYEPERTGDVKHSCADIRAARDMLGYVPIVDFNEGLRRTVAWYRALGE